MEEPRSKLRGIFDRKEFCLFFGFARQPRRKRRGMRSLLRFKTFGIKSVHIITLSFAKRYFTTHKPVAIIIKK